MMAEDEEEEPALQTAEDRSKLTGILELGEHSGPHSLLGLCAWQTLHKFKLHLWEVLFTDKTATNQSSPKTV